MRHSSSVFLALAIASALSGCVSAPASQPAARPQAAAPPPMSQPPPRTGSANAQTGGFIRPRVMEAPGLEGVIGASEQSLTALFGPPRLATREADAVKLQFKGAACVLDIFLYPLRAGSAPSATHVESRRASDGQAVDRASCVAALKR